ncbi:MAG: hypothetical protein GXX79_20935 [Actinomycetales bacterium]|nr:hypothetical protein [Actinomycetales bacterium]
MTLTGVVALLGACGGSEDSGATTSPGQGAPGEAGGPGGPGDMDMAAVQSCLEAAGIDLPTPTGTRRPEGSRTRPPEGSGTRPPRPTGSMTRSPGQGGPGGDGGMFALFQRDDVKTALQACGITVPTPGGRPRGSASPTTTSP